MAFLSLIEQLPTEMLMIILENFHPKEDIKDLLSICLVSKRFNDVAQQLIYHTFDKGSECGSCHTLSTRRGPMMYFLRTLIERPDLGDCVRRVELSLSASQLDPDSNWPEIGSSKALTMTGTSHTESTSPPILSSNMMEAFVAGIRRIDAPNKEYWLSKIINREMNPLAAVLIAHAPKMRHLTMHLGKKDLETFFFPLCGQRFLNQPYYLKKLVTLDLRGHWAGQGLRLNELKPVLRLSRLQTFTITRCIGDHGQEPFFIEPGAINVSTMYFGRCLIGANCMTALMNGCKNLRVFVYEIGYKAEIEQFDGSDVPGIFGWQQENIEILKINLGSKEVEGFKYGDYAKFGSFASMTSLKSLDIEQHYISADIEIPTSLTFLHIRNCEFPVYDILGALVDQSFKEGSKFSELFLQPKDIFVGGMFGMAKSIFDQNILVNPTLRAAAKRVCQHISGILKEAEFVFGIDSDVWEVFLRNEL